MVGHSRHAVVVSIVALMSCMEAIKAQEASSEDTFSVLSGRQNLHDTIFDQLDSDKNGRLSEGELTGLKHLDIEVSNPREILAKYDQTADRQIAKNEFYRVMYDASFTSSFWRFVCVFTGAFWAALGIGVVVRWMTTWNGFLTGVAAICILTLLADRLILHAWTPILTTFILQIPTTVILLFGLQTHLARIVQLMQLTKRVGSACGSFVISRIRPDPGKSSDNENEEAHQQEENKTMHTAGNQARKGEASWNSSHTQPEYHTKQTDQSTGKPWKKGILKHSDERNGYDRSYKEHESGMHDTSMEFDAIFGDGSPTQQTPAVNTDNSKGNYSSDTDMLGTGAASHTPFTMRDQPSYLGEKDTPFTDAQFHHYSTPHHLSEVTPIQRRAASRVTFEGLNGQELKTPYSAQQQTMHRRSGLFAEPVSAYGPKTSARRRNIPPTADIMSELY
eukprot:gb/GECG01005780.1/.p1 GENE.gb/GECG01005780.1/~~gb/GECG01005780.1/.p1  ORF type:complete len:448 (+),score=49.44 gb/GECG01005780.1/:1-1344(+)